MNADGLLVHYDRIADAPEAINRLRRFILDLAVRGKLVPQEAGDEPASELLTRIAKEKLLLAKAGGIRDKPALSPVAEADQPFQVPTSWEWVRFANIADFSAGRTPSRNDATFWNSGDHAWVSIADMVDGRVLDATKETVSSKARDKVFGSDPEPAGTMLMSFKLTIGKIARLGVPAFHNEAIISIRPHLPDLDGYLFKVLPQFARQGDTKGAIKGSTLNRDSLSNILLPIPPLAEQHRIVAKVDELMGLCDRLEAARSEREGTRDQLTTASLARLNAPDVETFQADARFALDALPALSTRPDQIKTLRQSILHLAVRGRLVTQDPNDKPSAVRAIDAPELAGRLDAEIPLGWRWVRVEDVADSRLGKMLDKAKNKGRPYPYLRNTNVHWFDIRLNDLKSIALVDAEFDEYRLQEGDVLICEGGHGIGRTAVWRGGPDNLVFQKALHRVRPGPHLDPDFFAQCCFVYFDAGIMQTYFTGVGIPHFTGRALSKLVFPLPPLTEQRRIVAKVDELMVVCDRLEATLTAAAATRSRLIETLINSALDPSPLEEAA
ncbi:MAG: restriction endonuclease subunit S [Alphaproteobacteria bacterium]|nr:restriction endonuclease subunit S [Alphaproteobacteria bacterium]